MTGFQKLALSCAAAMAITLTASTARAEDPAHRTTIDVPYAVQVDSIVLQPGRYVLRIMNPSESSVVSIYSADEKTLVATVSGVPVYRSVEAVKKAGGKTEFWFSAASTVRPRPVRAWFYPGVDKGIELVDTPSAKKAKKSIE